MNSILITSSRGFMFTSRTVFVVGAGGSYEVGLPIGDGLARKISDKLDSKRGKHRFSDDVLDESLHALARSHNSQDMTDWYRLAGEIARSMPLALSIDNFLHSHSNNKRIVDIGKLAIARCILEAESESDLFCRSDARIDFHALHDKYHTEKRPPSWHNTFFKMLTENVKKEELDNVFKHVTVITFNYDRCIEHYLANAFSQYMGIPMPEARVLCSKLEIIHPYGKVGEISPGTGSYTTFGATLHREQLLATSKQIRTFTERVTEQDMIDRMQMKLSGAKNVVFLGFSYGEMNLNLMQARGDKEIKHIVGSALGISESNRRHIENRLRQVLKLDYAHALPLHLENSTCYSVLNDFSKSLLN